MHFIMKELLSWYWFHFVIFEWEKPVTETNKYITIYVLKVSFTSELDIALLAEPILNVDNIALLSPYWQVASSLPILIQSV